MNAAVQPQIIETIFNHQVTEDEFKQLFELTESQEDYEFALSQTDAYIDVYYLYELRGNHALAHSYLNKLDEKTRNRITMRCCLN